MNILKISHGGLWIRWNKLKTSKGYRYIKLLTFYHKYAN